MIQESSFQTKSGKNDENPPSSATKPCVCSVSGDSHSPSQIMSVAIPRIFGRRKLCGSTLQLSILLVDGSFRNPARTQPAEGGW